MFEIQSYAPSPEAASLNVAVGFVVADATDTKETVESTLPKAKTAAKATLELTPEEKQQKLDTLVATPESTLRTYKVAELRDVAKGLLPRVNSYIKADLLDALLDIRQERIAQLEAIAVESEKSETERLERLRSQVDNSRSVRVATILKDMEQITMTELDAVARMQKVVTKAAQYLYSWKQLYKITSIKSILQDINNGFKENPPINDEVGYTRTLFKSTLWKLFDADKKLINQQDKAKVFERVTVETNKVNGSKLLDKAKGILEDVAQGIPHKYPDIVLALILVTGRRSAEILSTANFTPTDNAYEVDFTGQIKGKNENAIKKLQTVYRIPILADSSLVISGLNALADKRQGIKPDDVNKKYSKQLSRAAVEWSKDADAKLEAKDLRAIYAAMCRKLYYQGNERGLTAYFAGILGHDENDLNTAHSYLKFDVV